ncbi:hypothetical protein [Alcaligenes endophyticus]|uniref:Uncharacterized protein n=1 Tax=Alcaligenes endophyticus TaxID=1929088 RepID=A0ABT8EIZ7_9BURK|nr:hypothetical protein [Alcaligenes endophyticus]MCX5592538.1 hypothetical protein [Alcaligenes endophyticus]MDN4121264.1 hypothetical protein [Alcaligenes endophyticus]
MKKDLQVITKEFTESLPQSVKSSFVELAKKEMQSPAVFAAMGEASISSSDSGKLSTELVNHVVSEEFLGQLVGEVGEPQQNETKEEYLARAKADFMKLLDGKTEGAGTVVLGSAITPRLGIGSLIAKKLFFK